MPAELRPGAAQHAARAGMELQAKAVLAELMCECCSHGICVMLSLGNVLSSCKSMWGTWEWTVLKSKAQTA